MDASDAAMVARKAAWFWLGWDQDNLYLAAKVNSPFAAYNNARQGMNAWWCFDSVQLRTFFPDDGQITHWGFYKDAKTGEDFVDTQQGAYQHEVLGENPPGSRVVILANPDGTGYTMEAACPWAFMAPHVEIKPGLEMKVAVQFNWCNPQKTEKIAPDGQMYFRGAMNFRTPADWTVMKLGG
jgi:hypothetical protein